VILFFVVLAMPQSVLGDDDQEKMESRFHKKLRFSFHVGATYPLGDQEAEPEGIESPSNNLNYWADSNIHFRFNLDYAFSDRIDLVAFWGFSQFTDDIKEVFTPSGSYLIHQRHYYTFNFSVNWKLLFPSWSGTNYKWYLQAGPGYYVPKPGLSFPYPTGSTWGFNVGFGGQIPFSTGPFDLEWGVDLHNMNLFDDDQPKFWFLTLQLGALFK
jgi:hypothetical protein